MSIECVLLVVITILGTVCGHGMVLSPAGRGSRWRTDSTAIANYEDNENFCGGFYIHQNVNGGRCGLCGDNWSAATPRKHELGGLYGGKGVITGTYRQGGQMLVTVLLTANHYGYFTFNICNLDTGTESDPCFGNYRLTFANSGGSTRYPLTTSAVGNYNMILQLPSDLVCKRCVLQWTYTTGNSWGVCENGTGALGCGKQETFRTCSDIQILR